MNTPCLHDQLVTQAVAEMRRLRMTGIKADHIPGYTQPDQIGGYIPDVFGLQDDKPWVVECESRDGLTQTHTESQWRAFFSYATRHGGYFVAVVAKADETQARTLLRTVAGNAQNAQVWTF